jgi:hypothetical protein
VTPVLRHVLMLKWARPLENSEVAGVGAAFDQLAAATGTVRALAHGPDAGLRAAGYDYVLVADFDDEAGWRAYDTHPAHHEVRRLLGPIKAEARSAQFYAELADSAITHAG